MAPGAFYCRRNPENARAMHLQAKQAARIQRNSCVQIAMKFGLCFNHGKRNLGMLNLPGILTVAAILYSAPFVVPSLWSTVERYSAAGFAKVEPFGLQEHTITSLAAEIPESGSLSKLPDLLFAGTADSGVYQRWVSEATGNWQSIGPESAHITALGVQHWGVGPMDGLRLFAGSQIDTDGGEEVALFLNEIGQFGATAWVRSDSGLDRAAVKKIMTVGAYYYTGHTPPQPVLLGGEAGLYRSAGGAAGYWEKVHALSAAIVRALDVRPHWFGKEAWAVGEVDNRPAIFRSKDQGATWDTLFVPGMESVWHAIVLHPRNPDSVIVAGDVGVVATADGGRSWSLLLDAPESVRLQALAVDPLNPDILSAGGATAGSAAILFLSKNGGRSWEEIQLPGGVSMAPITTMVILRPQAAGGTSVLYFGTSGTGMWRLVLSTVTPVRPNSPRLEHFHLLPNKPNPFSSQTRIRFYLAKPGDVAVDIFSLTGRHLWRRTYRMMTAGEQSILWSGRDKQGRDLPPGVYLYRVSAAGMYKYGKMLLLR